MALFPRFASLLRSLAANQKGTTAVTFALSIVPVLLMAGAAVDYVRYTDARTKLQAALDTGALAIAASSNLSASERIKTGTATFNHNLALVNVAGEDVTSSFKITGSTVTANAELALPSSLMQLAGLTEMVVSAETEISMSESKKIELALVLDYSGSMEEVSGGQIKYVAMKNAAKKLVTDLESGNAGKFKAGLVPFSHHVYLSIPSKFVRGQSGSGTWTGCTQDRRYPHNLTSATPTSDDETKWGQPIAKIHSKEGCAGYAPNSLKVAPLTEDIGGINAQLDAMRPYAWTHIALGAEFGFHLLSPNAPFTEGAAFGDKKVSKIMVLLTDGRQTEPAFGDGVRNVRQGERNLEAICQNAKDSGITIITIAFDLRDKDTRNRLSECATDPDKHFYVAEDSTDVARAFEDIKQQIASQVFISR